tara:strand:- start:237 stop:398 length:162 start_codon:yes stop_codon:yes gene_type:complete
MKYIVAVKYRDSSDLLFKTELFEFDSKKGRDDFVKDARHLAEDLAFSQIGEKD